MAYKKIEDTKFTTFLDPDDPAHIIGVKVDNSGIYQVPAYQVLYEDAFGDLTLLRFTEEKFIETYGFKPDLSEQSNLQFTKDHEGFVKIAVIEGALPEDLSAFYTKNKAI